MREVAALLAQLGIDIRVIAPLGATPADIARLGEADFNAVLYPEIAGKARAGDIRHCIPDIDHAVELLGYEPQEDFRDGLIELAAWVARQQADDRVHEARKELEARGLVS